MEPPASYVKGIVAMILLTEFLRVADALTNWNFLWIHSNYSLFFRFDLVFILAGVLLVVFSLRNVKLGIGTGFGYSISGILLTVFDPDFGSFASNPLGYFFGMEPVVSLMFTLGTLSLLVMLVISFRGYASLRVERGLGLRSVQ